MNHPFSETKSIRTEEIHDKDISSAIYRAERKSGLSSDVRQGIFDSILCKQAVVRYLDEELEQEDGDGLDEDEDPEEAEDPEPILRM